MSNNMLMVFKVAVAGCTGYAGGEILRLLVSHPHVAIGAITAGASAGQRLGECQKHLTFLADQKILETNLDNLREHDVVFLALPSGESAKIAKLLPDNILVIDCGADYRLLDEKEWHKYYGTLWAGSWPYGLPELPNQRKILAAAKRIAVPGCYPTVSTLALLPAIKNNLIDPNEIVIVAASGVSGAGRVLKPNLLGAELIGAASAYGAGGVHRHIPEIKQNLIRAGALSAQVSFTPFLVPMSRGILATCVAPLRTPKPELRRIYESYYLAEPFVSVLPQGVWPNTSTVLGSNNVQIQVEIDSEANKLVAIGAIDNLVKGTAGGAIQCMNIALGIDESIGLSTVGVAP